MIYLNENVRVIYSSKNLVLQTKTAGKKVDGEITTAGGQWKDIGYYSSFRMLLRGYAQKQLIEGVGDLKHFAEVEKRIMEEIEKVKTVTIKDFMED